MSRVRGQIVPLQQMLDGFRTGLLVAILVIFLLLAANFQSLKLSFVVISTVPAVIAGVMLCALADRNDHQYSIVHGGHHGGGRGGRQCDPARDFCRASRMAGATAEVAAIEGAKAGCARSS